MSPNLANYVFSHYGYLMSNQEKRAYSHLAGTMKATMGRSDMQAQQEARQHESFSRFISNDPQVLLLTCDGYELFVDRTAERILAEHPNTIFFNYCPRCHELARTPRAQQCRFCGLDWHSTQSKREN